VSDLTLVEVDMVAAVLCCFLSRVNALGCLIALFLTSNPQDVFNNNNFYRHAVPFLILNFVFLLLLISK
jgi:cell shape-determining protein MreD